MKNNKVISAYDNCLCQYGSISYESEDLRDPKGVVDLVKKIVGEDAGRFYIILNVDKALNPINIYPIVTKLRGDSCWHLSLTDVLRSAVISNAYGFFVVYSYGHKDIHFTCTDIAFYLDLKKAAISLGIRLMDHILTDLSYSILSFAENEEVLKRYLVDRISTKC